MNKELSDIGYAHGIFASERFNEVIKHKGPWIVFKGGSGTTFKVVGTALESFSLVRLEDMVDIVCGVLDDECTPYIMRFGVTDIPSAVHFWIERVGK